MSTIQIQLAITVDEVAAKKIADLLAPALGQATGQSTSEFDERRRARMRASQNANLGGQEPADDMEFLIDSKKAAKRLHVSERTLWKMHTTGEMPPPIRIGRTVRWSFDALKKWVEAGCPAVQ